MPVIVPPARYWDVRGCRLLIPDPGKGRQAYANHDQLQYNSEYHMHKLSVSGCLLQISNVDQINQSTRINILAIIMTVLGLSRDLISSSTNCELTVPSNIPKN